MALPTKKLEQSFIITTCTLPVSKLKVKFHAMKHGDAKVFILLKEDVTFTELLEHIKQLFQSCIVSEIDLDTLSLVDVEYLFLQIHIASKGNISSIQYKCQNEIEKGRKCQAPVLYELNLNDIQPTFSKQEKVYQIPIKNTDLTIILKDVLFGDLEHIPNNSGVITPENVLDNIVLSVDKIIEGSGDNAIVYSEFTKEEISEFVDGLSEETVAEIQEKFLDRDTKLQHSIELQCMSCKSKAKIELNGMLDFIG